LATDIRALGIDVGSTTVKIVSVDAAGNLDVVEMLE
jgi:activator of 2-hydroxyglutaryl-CoA dehydratase